MGEFDGDMPLSGKVLQVKSLHDGISNGGQKIQRSIIALGLGRATFIPKRAAA